MKLTRKQLVIGGAAVAAVVIGYLVYRAYFARRPREAAFVSTIGGVATHRLDRIVMRGDHQAELVRVAGEWRIQGRRADPVAVDQLLTTVTRIGAGEVGEAIDSSPAQWVELGVADGQGTDVVLYADYRPLAHLVFSRPTVSGLFVRTGDRVYRVPAQEIGSFFRSGQDWFDARAPGPPAAAPPLPVAEDPARLSGAYPPPYVATRAAGIDPAHVITLVLADGQEAVILERTGNAWRATGPNGRPLAGDAIQHAEVRRALDEMTAALGAGMDLRAPDVAADPAAATFSVRHDDGRTVTIWFDRDTRRDNIDGSYAKSSADNARYFVPAVTRNRFFALAVGFRDRRY